MLGSVLPLAWAAGAADMRKLIVSITIARMHHRFII